MIKGDLRKTSNRQEISRKGKTKHNKTKQKQIDK